MTLDEAIKHCEEVADYDCYNENQLECAKDHWQLAEWLRELKLYKESGWHPFRQEQDPETGLWKFVDPPADWQRILVTIRSQTGENDPFVQEDVWYENGYDLLESGYTPGAEAIAWMAWPEPYVPDTDVGRMEVENEESHR